MNFDTAPSLKQQVNDVIFGYDSRAGKLFDVVLIFMIVISVSAVLFDSVDSYNDRYGEILLRLEWFFTILFTIIVIRIMRVLRIFRILKLFRYMGEANLLYTALLQARRKIFVFLFTVLILIVIFGALMFIIEGPENGFNSIPESIYWAIVTITTVGYGDVSPQTPVGQFVAALAMICGYAIIAVPTGIIGAELMNEFQHRSRTPTNDKRKCVSCKATGHDLDARYCKYCGNLIH